MGCTRIWAKKAIATMSDFLFSSLNENWVRLRLGPSRCLLRVAVMLVFYRCRIARRFEGRITMNPFRCNIPRSRTVPSIPCCTHIVLIATAASCWDVNKFFKITKAINRSGINIRLFMNDIGDEWLTQASRYIIRVGVGLDGIVNTM